MTRKYFVVYDERCGRVVADALIESDVIARLKQWNQSDTPKFTSDVIGSAQMVDAYLLAALQGRINYNEIEFYHDETPLYIDDGKLMVDPKTPFTPVGGNFAQRIIRYNETCL